MNERRIHPGVQFFIAGWSGMMACLCVHPLDLLKNRMQVNSHKSLLNICFHVYKQKRLAGFYQGLTGGLLRQATYGSVRVGTYMQLMNQHRERHGEVELYNKLMYACFAGVCGAIIGTPGEVVLVRMTANETNMSNRNYKHALDAVFRIYREEGLLTLWSGLGPTINRAVIANAAELTAYSQSKQWLLATTSFQDNIYTHVVCSLLAAVTNVTFSLPLDVAKTRIQNSGKEMRTIHVLRDAIRLEGVTALWTGFIPSLSCIGPRTVLIFVFIEFITQQYNKIVLGQIKHSSSGL